MTQLIRVQTKHKQRAARIDAKDTLVLSVYITIIIYIPSSFTMMAIRFITVSWILTLTASLTKAVDREREKDTQQQQPLQLHRPFIGLRHSYRTVDLLNDVVVNRSTKGAPASKLSLEQTDKIKVPVTNPTNKNDELDDDIQELYFTQILDHYDGRNNQTFQQRYFRSDRFVRRPRFSREGGGNEPVVVASDQVTLVFVCVGGEGPAFDTSVLRDSVHCTGDMIESAQQLFNNNNDPPNRFNVVLIALEHRYYGASYPTFGDNASSVTNENLKYLSSRQATADLAHFIHTLFHHPSMMVYLFGGSYPGMMAAFTRTKYPYLIRGAISSSAPVQAVLNFDTYQSHVGYNLRQIDMNCYNIVTMGHLGIVKMLQRNDTATIQSLAQQFNLCNSDTVLLSRENQNLFVGDGVVYFGAQENDPHCNNNDDPFNFCNMEQICNALTTQYTKEMNTTNATIEVAALNSLAYLTRTQQQQQHTLNGNDELCFVVDWNETLNYIADPILGQADGLRSWLYQTCTEFGFYQTCFDHKCPFGIGYHSLQQDLFICQYAFRIYNTAQAVQSTNEWTGGWENIEQTSRIFSVTGTVDPWSEMAIQHTSPSFNNQDTKINLIDYPIPYQVHGASHHFWTHPSQKTDDEAIVAARQKIYQTLHDWIVSDVKNYNKKELHLHNDKYYAYK